MTAHDPQPIHTDARELVSEPPTAEAFPDQNGPDPAPLATAPTPSHVVLPPDTPCTTILEFLDLRFPYVGREVWLDRLRQGKVTDDEGRPIEPDRPYQANLRLGYFRETRREPIVPFTEDIVFQDEHLLIACKPHFLPVIPSGPYVNECLLNRLRLRTGNPDLVPVNRLDRETAGLVMFSAKRETRGLYYKLFMHRRVTKHYEAVGTQPSDHDRTEWVVESRIVDGKPWFLSCQVDGPVNARSRIRRQAMRDGLARFELEPLTGKKHQLRLHMAAIGSGILNDPFYPKLRPFQKQGFSEPLQLLARRLAFRDPITDQAMVFESQRRLKHW